MSFWRRIHRIFFHDPPTTEEEVDLSLLEAEPDDDAPPPASEARAQEVLQQQGTDRLATQDRASSLVLAEVAVGPPRAAPQATPEELRMRELLAELERHPGLRQSFDAALVDPLIQTLVHAGRERVVAELLRRICELVPQQAPLRLRLASLLYDLGERKEAAHLLHGLTGVPCCRIEAHEMLGGYYSLEAEPALALRHYEAVLALSFSRARIRRRADELRRNLELPGSSQSTPTMLGIEDLGQGARFQIRKELGRGGGGAVYLALDRSLDRLVAVKVLHPQLARKAGALEHLFCEARIATSLHHPQIVTIYDLDEKLNLVVMEHCAGGTLASAMAGGAALSLDAALRRLAQITGVLDTVHRCGVVHRDLKPSNLLLRPPEPTLDTELVLTDFGIAHAGAWEEGETQAGGSLVYVAPEQRRGAAADPRADLYACGVLLLEMILGRPPLDQAQALQGAQILDLGDLWQDLSGRLSAPPAASVLELARELVCPDPKRRPGEAAAVRSRALDLLLGCERWSESQAVKDELARLAGPSPHPDPVRLWLESPWSS